MNVMTRDDRKRTDRFIARVQAQFGRPIGFWGWKKRLVELRRLLRSGGRIAVAHQPRGPDVTDAISAASGSKIAAQLARAGFSDVRIETLRLKPAVVGVIGINRPPEGA